MELVGADFPGIPDAALGHSQRSYSYDPVGTLTQQSSQYLQLIDPTRDNVTYNRPPFGTYRVEALTPGNLEQTHPAVLHDPGWWQNEFQVYSWDGLRAAGVGYGLYAPHLPQNPVPVWKLVEPGSGFVVPATFLGQPLAPQQRGL